MQNNKPAGRRQNRQGSNNSKGSFRGRSRNSNFSRFGRGKGRKATKRLDRNLFISEPLTESQIEQNQKDADSHSPLKFSSFNFSDTLQKNIDEKGFTETTEIQTEAIPHIIQGKDLLGISETGSGKTAAFLIPIIDQLLKNKNKSAIILSPTRELALQIKKEAISFVRKTNIHIALVIGGESMGRQISDLKRSRLIIGTPGRVKDMLTRELIDPKDLNMFVLDEVDRMLDMGFITDIKWIYSLLENNEQSVFFSATQNRSVNKIISDFSTDYKTVKLSDNKANPNIDQSVIDFRDKSEKIDLLEKIIAEPDFNKAIIFVETKRFADSVEKELLRKDYKISALHGDKRQNVRKRVIGAFRDSKINLLVATNVAARGIDIDDISHVINLDEPEDYNEYIHRIGRTGRNGRKGKAYTFVKS